MVIFLKNLLMEYPFWNIKVLFLGNSINKLPFLKNQIKNVLIKGSLKIRCKGQPAYSLEVHGRVMIHHPTYTHLSALLSQRSYKCIWSSFLCFKFNTLSSFKKKKHSGIGIVYGGVKLQPRALVHELLQASRPRTEFEPCRAPYQLNPTAQWVVGERFSQVIIQPHCWNS